MSVAKAKFGTLAIAANVLRVRPGKNKFALSVQILSLLLVCLYIVFFYKIAFPWYAYTTKRFVLAFFGYLLYGFGCNFGLFFITTTKAKEMRVLATILYSPTVLVTPLVVSLFSPYYPSVIATFLFSLLIYYYFNPWRQDV